VLGNQGAELILGGTAGDELWALADAMQDAWIAFARTGEPSHPGLPAWPAWDAAERAVMRLDVDREVLLDPAGAERALWEGVL
jgi:para-nitrobenzyl esterase